MGKQIELGRVQGSLAALRYSASSIRIKTPWHPPTRAKFLDLVGCFSDKCWTSLYLPLAMVLWFMGVLHGLLAVSLVCVLIGSADYTKMLVGEGRDGEGKGLRMEEGRV